MASYNNVDEMFTDICNSLRTKLGTTGEIKHSDIASKILSISGEGGGGGGTTTTQPITISKEFVEKWIGQGLEDGSSALQEIKEAISNNPFTLYSLFGTFATSRFTTFDFGEEEINNIFNMNVLFAGCENLTSISNLDKLKTNSVISMDSLFSSCGFTEFTFPNWDTSNCENFSYLFGYCQNLTTLDLSNLVIDGNNRNIRYSNMFNGCMNLQTLKLGPGFSPYGQEYEPIKLFENSYDINQDLRLLMGGNTNFATNENSFVTLNLTQIWQGTDETKIARFVEFANSLGVCSSSQSRNIEIYTDLYNALTEDQKNLIINKGYNLTYSNW